MEATRIETLEAMCDALGSLVSDEFDQLTAGAVSDAGVLDLLRLSGRLRRAADALGVAATGQVVTRSQGSRGEKLTSRTGAATVNEVVRNAGRCEGRGAKLFEKAAGFVGRERSITSGELTPARFPELARALRDAELGVGGLLAAAEPLAVVAGRVDAGGLAAADAALAAAARGASVDELTPGADLESGAPMLPPLCPDDLGNLSRIWVSHLDVDGAVPREDEAVTRRGFGFRPVKGGLVPIYGGLLPEVAAQFQVLFDAILNPRAGQGPLFEPDTDAGDELVPPKDPRTSAQKQHDALASILAAAARAAGSPSLGGGAPTLVVTVAESDLASGTGEGRVDGFSAPVGPAGLAHVACTASVQRVLHDDTGRITSIHTMDRVFNARQRRAIMARDGGCVIPGCGVRAAWAEIHHVTEWAKGGPTHTDNGCLLCWGHHRTLDISGWEIRMRTGTVEIRGPGWWDPERRWRPARNNLTTLPF